MQDCIYCPSLLSCSQAYRLACSNGASPCGVCSNNGFVNNCGSCMSGYLENDAFPSIGLSRQREYEDSRCIALPKGYTPVTRRFVGETVSSVTSQDVLDIDALQGEFLFLEFNVSGFVFGGQMIRFSLTTTLSYDSGSSFFVEVSPCTTSQTCERLF